MNIFKNGAPLLLIAALIVVVVVLVALFIGFLSGPTR